MSPGSKLHPKNTPLQLLPFGLRIGYVYVKWILTTPEKKHPITIFAITLIFKYLAVEVIQSLFQ